MTLGQRIFDEKEFEVFGGINLPESIPCIKLITMPWRVTPDLVSGSIQVRECNEEQVVLHHIQEGRDGQLQCFPHIQKHILIQPLHCHSQDFALKNQDRTKDFIPICVNSISYMDKILCVYVIILYVLCSNHNFKLIFVIILIMLIFTGLFAYQCYKPRRKKINK